MTYIWSFIFMTWKSEDGLMGLYLKVKHDRIWYHVTHSPTVDDVCLSLYLRPRVALLMGVNADWHILSLREGGIGGCHPFNRFRF